jgi:hypothetical protein
MNAMGSLFPSFTNLFANLSFVKKGMGIAQNEKYISKANFQEMAGRSRTTKINF